MLLQEVRELETNGKGARRPRNTALTWDVPPQLDDEPTEAGLKGGPPPAEPTATAPARVGRAAVHPLVALQRTAFQETADRHLQAVVRQLLGAEEPAVSC